MPKNNFDLDEFCCPDAPKREFYKFTRRFKITGKCDGEDRVFFRTHPAVLAPNIGGIITVINSSLTCDFLIKVVSGCDIIEMLVPVGSTGNFYVGQINEMLFSCVNSGNEPCSSQSDCRAMVLIDGAFIWNH
ncbi:hypothetical protein ABEO66_29990 [Bacillus pacificus]|uniref:hypothetical protein n=1 Tax=Bacillus pacificus TaxID=2026187 RepID=UPI003D1CCF2F